MEELSYLEDMKSSRGVAAVLKARLAQIRSSAPDIPILSFEGPDDKLIYYAWTSRVRPGFKYEPFVCNGKDGVLTLRRMVRRDLGNIGEGVYFLIDRDFDDLRGEEESDDLFMTDLYSVENYLVDEQVLDELLKNEFHCHGGPVERKKIIEIFAKLYDEFQTIVRPINYRLYIARKLNVELAGRLPDRIARIASVSLFDVKPAGSDAARLIEFTREPSADEVQSIHNEFANLSPRDRFRGKFFLLFFLKWLEHLASDRNSENPKCFQSTNCEMKANFSLLTLGALAGKSPMPSGFAEFIDRVKAPRPLQRAA